MVTHRATVTCCATATAQTLTIKVEKSPAVWYRAMPR